MNEIICCNCINIMSEIDEDSIHLVITSPPYEDRRIYDSKNSGFMSQRDFELISKYIYKVLVPGGVLVWVISDKTSNFCESLNSFRQAIYFVDKIGFNLVDTMIYKKRNYIPGCNIHRKYSDVFEYMFIFSKGRPRVFNPLLENKSSVRNNKTSFRNKDGSIRVRNVEKYINSDLKLRTNVWEYLIGPFADKNMIKFKHPATFPDRLVEDHILTWTNEGDIVLDPMAGSGTVPFISKKLNRKYIGIDISENYCNIARDRINGKIVYSNNKKHGKVAGLG